MPLNKLHWLHHRHIINYYLLYACGIHYSCLLVFHITVGRCVKTPWLIPANSWEIVHIDLLSNSWALTLSWRSLFAVECWFPWIPWICDCHYESRVALSKSSTAQPVFVAWTKSYIHGVQSLGEKNDDMLFFRLPTVKFDYHCINTSVPIGMYNLLYMERLCGLCSKLHMACRESKHAQNRSLSTPMSLRVFHKRISSSSRSLSLCW